MSNIAVLKAELAAGHPDTGAYSADAAMALAELQAVNRTRLVAIPSTELLAWSASSGRYNSIKAAADDTSHAVNSVAAAAYLMITRDETSLDLNLADRVAFVDALVNGGVLTADDRTSLNTLATENISRETELGLSGTKVGHILEARL